MGPRPRKRNERDEKGCNAHEQQRGDQRRLAADAIAVMAENRGADRSGGKADEIGAEGGERRRKRFLVGEVKLAEDETGRGANKGKSRTILSRCRPSMR